MADQTLTEKLEDYRDRFRKNRRLKRVSAVVAICLACVATVGLMIPAVTLEYAKPACGIEEHAHTEACYTKELVCSLPATNAHVHVPSCYSVSGEIICGQDSTGHLHVESCYEWGEPVLVCTDASPDHVHTDACYVQDKTLICEEEETVHIHDLSCFDANGNKTCTSTAAHVHGDTCYLVEEDVTEGATNEASLNAEMDPVLVCTEETVGHVHDSYCKDAAGNIICGQTEEILMPHVHDEACYEEIITCGKEEHIHTDLCFDEINQEVMKAQERKELEEQAGLGADNVISSTPEESLSAEELEDLKSQGLVYENDDLILAFEAPDDIKDGLAIKVTETFEETADVETATNTNSSNLHPISTASIVDDENAEGASEDVAEVTTDEVVDESATAEDTDAAVTESSGEILQNEASVADVVATDVSDDEDGYIWLTNLEITAYLDGEKVDNIADLGLTAKLQMKSRVIAPILDDIDYSEVDPEIKDEVGAEISVVQQPLTTSSASISDINTQQIDEMVVTSLNETSTSFNLISNVLTARAANTPNAHFLVQYLAPVPQPVLSSSGTLPIINTEKGGMPTSDDVGVVEYLNLNSNGSVITSDEPQPIYREEDFWYFKSPTLDHFNKVYKNTNYKLERIKVYQGAALVGNYTFDKDVTHFTNRKESQGWHDGLFYILIPDESTIKLIYGLTPGTETIDSTFYDYDISDGKIYSSLANANAAKDGQNTSNQGTSATWYAKTNASGINNSDNYSGNGTKLGFGNINTGTGLGPNIWNGNYLNMSNFIKKNAFNGCTFGLVSSLDSDGNIIYSNGVDAPNLFNEGTAIGKTTYDNVPMTFSRVGDTYTLSSVDIDGHSTSGLGSLKNPHENYPKIWTNNFWPVDNTDSHGTDGHDMKFGNSSSTVKSKRKYAGVSQDWVNGKGEPKTYNANGTLPPSDDIDNDHNSYFGMHYTVTFNLTEDYEGPLDYLFFGDDDLWIFLDGKLVVDIGGVHSSVGEYVNLWDHLSKGTEGEHTLSVYYTERGASGSTCYMNFTLPSVSETTIEQDTNDITILKKVAATTDEKELDKEFDFTIKLTDKDGNKLANDYSYTRYDAKGGEIESNLIIWDGGTFRLKNGEFITINYLPIGATYEIQEYFGEDDDPPYYGDPPYYISWNYSENKKSVSSNSGGEMGKLPKAFIGTIGDSTSEYMLEYTNTVAAKLPATGGIGSHWYLIGGALIVILGIVLLRRRMRTGYVGVSDIRESDHSDISYKRARQRVRRTRENVHKGGRL